MKKKIEVSKLEPGMFICDFSCGWLQHPFLSKTIKIKDSKTIEKIVKYGIQNVYIDTSRGTDIADAPTEKEVMDEISIEINEVIKFEKESIEPVPVQEEIIRAKKIKKEAKQTVCKVMEDIRMGKQLEIEKVDHVVDQMVASIFRNKNALITLGRLKTIDDYTFFHSLSVGIILISFGKHLGYDQKTVKAIGIAGILHDIGKMKIPAEILTKPGRLTENEFNMIKGHVEHGRTILEQTPGINKTAIQIAYEHHERMDGTGYPCNLKGGEISQLGQMAAIADVYDAITSNRCYHKATEPTDALKKLFEWSEHYFSRELVQQFIRCVGIYPVGTLVRLESGLLGIILAHENNSLLQPVIRIVYNTKRNKYISPYDVDLSVASTNKTNDKILNYELPDRWNIYPEAYL